MNGCLYGRTIAEGMEGNEWLSVWEDNISIAEGMEGNE